MVYFTLGVPFDFDKKSWKRVHHESVLFVHVQSIDIPGLTSVFGQSEYFPYVYYKINIDMLEVSNKN